jgi:hypothetical protein
VPFTISHIAATLPLRNRRLPFSALAIGSMSPDFSYIVALIGPRIESHTVQGLFVFSIPAALFVWWIYLKFLMKPWSVVFPWLQCDQFDESIGSVVVAVAIGALTHNIWDGFTHRSGWPVEQLEILRMPFEVGTMQRPVYGWLQHLSSIFGMIVLYFALRRERRRMKAQWVGSKSQLAFCALGFAVLFLAFNSSALVSFVDQPVFAGAESRLVLIAFRGLAAAAIVIATFPLFSRAFRKRAT